MTLAFISSCPSAISKTTFTTATCPFNATFNLARQNDARLQFIPNMSISTGSNINSNQTEQPAISQTQNPDRDAFGFGDADFQEEVKGEWFGYEASFSVRDGKPRNIEEKYVPDEFRNWGVEIKGFDSLTSTTCPNDDSVFIKHTRALPTVGCEADAVVPEVTERTWDHSKVDEVNGGFSDGSLSCSPALMTDELSQRWNVCLVDPTVGEKRRARLQFGPVNQPFGQVGVIIERWESAFCGGEVLPGCGGNNGAFAESAPLNAATELAGTWNSQVTTYHSSHEGWHKETRVMRVERSAEDAQAEVNVALPSGLSVGITTTEQGEKHVIAGWMPSADKRIVLRSVYGSTGVLCSVCQHVETKQS